MDGGMIQAHIADRELGFVGEIDAIHTEILSGLLLHQYVPIVAPLGLGSDGSCLNVNADEVAARLAAALGAEALLFLSDVAGIYQDDGTCLSTLLEERALELIEQGSIRGGMIPKVRAALTAVPHVSRVLIVDGREPSILLRAAFAHARVGTRLAGQTPARDALFLERFPEKPAQPGACSGMPSLLHLD
jgi:acetylglutamate kinase